MKKLFVVFVLAALFVLSAGQDRARNVPIYSTPAAFSPSDLSGLKVWLKADALSLSDGDAVSSWTDSSGLGNHATQGTAGDRPIFKTNIIGGKPVVRFDGSSDFLETPYAASDASDNAQTWLAVFKTNTVSVVQLMVWAGNGSANGFGTEDEIHMGIGRPPVGNTNQIHVWFSDRENAGATFTDTTGFHILGATFSNLASGTVTFYSILDGTKNSSTASGANTFSNWSGVTRIGRPGAATRFYNGDIAELVIYSSALSDSDREQVESYFRTKYGLGPDLWAWLVLVWIFPELLRRRRWRRGRLTS